MDVKLTPQVMNTKNLKKSTSFTFEYFSKDKASSQAMYVKKNPYAQASKQYVFVKKDSDLGATHNNLYRSNDGQLIQSSSVFEADKSSNTLYSYHETSVNNYQYNYASSPEGNLVTSISENTPFEKEQQRKVSALTITTTSTGIESNPCEGVIFSSDSSNYMNYNFLVKNS